MTVLLTVVAQSERGVMAGADRFEREGGFNLCADPDPQPHWRHPRKKFCKRRTFEFKARNQTNQTGFGGSPGGGAVNVLQGRASQTGLAPTRRFFFRETEV